MLFPPFLGGSARADNPSVVNEQTINFYPEQSPSPNAKVPLSLYPTPGMATVMDTTKAAGRALFYQRGKIYGVVGDEFYEFDIPGGNILYRGTVLDDATHTPATITANGDGGNQVVIAAGGALYVYDMTTNAFATVVASGVLSCGMLDGYVYYLDDASTLHVSEVYDATTLIASQQRDMAPDPWRACISVGRSIVLIGEHTLERWYNAGTAPFPFAPHPSDGIGVGIAARHSLAAIGDGCIWLSQTRDGIGDVMLMLGGAPQSVSTHALRSAIEGYLEDGLRVTDAMGDVYEERGHTFYVLTFPTANATWVYDLATGLWHERGRWDSTAGAYEAWRPMWHVFAEERHLWLDRASGKLYQTRLDYPNDVDGNPIRRLRRGAPFWSDNQQLIFGRFELLIQPGLGLNVSSGTAGYDPQAELRYSNDDGQTWVYAGLRSGGRRGQYGTTLVWNRLGTATNRVFEIVVDAPIPWRILGADVDVRPGLNR